MLAIFLALLLLLCPSSGHPPTGSLSGYLTLAETVAWTKAVVGNFSEVAELHTIGKSFEGRTIDALCIGVCSSIEQVPEVLFNSLHHSREPMGLMTLVHFIDELLTRFKTKDPEVVALMQTRSLWFVLVVNPDGYEYNRLHFKYRLRNQRKNRRPTCAFDQSKGVDINRNYAFCFNKDTRGSSVKPCDEDYSGAFAFSEPETQAMKLLVEARNFTIAFNYHSFGKTVYVPYACKMQQYNPNPNDEFFKHYASELVRSNGYAWGHPWAMNLYPVNGDAADWMYHEHNIFAVSPEVAPTDPVPSDDYGFWPPANKIRRWSRENLDMNFYGAWAAGPFLDFTSVEVRVDLASFSIFGTIVNKGVWHSVGDVRVLVRQDDTFQNATNVGRLSAKWIGQHKFNLRVSTDQRERQTVHVVVHDKLYCVVQQVDARLVAGKLDVQLGELTRTTTTASFCRGTAPTNETFASGAHQFDTLGVLNRSGRAFGILGIFLVVIFVIIKYRSRGYSLLAQEATEP